MPITTLKITDFRNLAFVDLAPHATGMNIFCGDNGSGKTSLLEAVHYLSSGKSFRSSAPARLIRHETEKFALYAQVTHPQQVDGNMVRIGMERHISGDTRLRMEEKELGSMAEIAASLPVRLIHSQSHQLLEAGPVYRRKYLDWGLFYHSERFLPCWRQFERILRQRNAVLKEKRSKQELNAWTDELISYGQEFDCLRKDYIHRLEPVLAAVVGELLDLTQLELVYDRGWDEPDYATALANALQDDFRCGFTQVGPHRADFDIYSDGLPVKHFLSRGQQKLLICAMIIAQGMLLTECLNKRLIYLIDDLPSELDVHSRYKLMSLLTKQPAQIFITAIKHEDVCVGNNSMMPMKVFHVEHGSVTE